MTPEYATGLTRSTGTLSLVSFPYTYTAIDRCYIVGTATAASSYVKDTSHMTVDANGEVTSLVSDFDFICEWQVLRRPFESRGRPPPPAGSVTGRRARRRAAALPLSESG